jgi:hypothetical protein
MKNDHTAVSADAASLDVLQNELQERLAPQVAINELSDEIIKLLRRIDTKITRETLAVNLARDLTKKFRFLKSRELERLIANRPVELETLLKLSRRDDYQRAAEWVSKLPKAKGRAKITSDKERIRRTKAAKHWYERCRRSHVTSPGWIERDFAERPRSSLLDSHHIPIPAGPCLDQIFHGGAIKTYDEMYSLPSLFGLSRKKLSAAGRPIRRGRESFYDYRAVLRCIVALLKQTGPDAPWLPDATQRRIVLICILLRARQEATPKIREAFDKKLVPYLN